MVYGYHAIFGTYGFWLPNDPRGSWSDFVGLYELYRKHGPATTTTERRSLAYTAHDSTARGVAKKLLPRQPVFFNGMQAQVVSKGFGESFHKGQITVWACAILPDHVHVVFARHVTEAEHIVNFMKGKATAALVKAGLHPFPGEQTESGKIPHCWAQGQWIVYLENEGDIKRAIHYTEQNPIKNGLPLQRWSFVTPFSREPLASVGTKRSPEARG